MLTIALSNSAANRGLRPIASKRPPAWLSSSVAVFPVRIDSVSPCQERASISPSNSVQSRSEPGAPRDRRRPMSVSRYVDALLPTMPMVARAASNRSVAPSDVEQAAATSAACPAPESRASITPRATAEYSTAVMRCPPTRSSRWSFGSAEANIVRSPIGSPGDRSSALSPARACAAPRSEPKAFPARRQSPAALPPSASAAPPDRRARRSRLH